MPQNCSMTSPGPTLGRWCFWYVSEGAKWEGLQPPGGLSTHLYFRASPGHFVLRGGAGPGRAPAPGASRA